jgi:hypothetical protein
VALIRHFPSTALPRILQGEAVGLDDGKIETAHREEEEINRTSAQEFRTPLA